MAPAYEFRHGAIYRDKVKVAEIWTCRQDEIDALLNKANEADSLLDACTSVARQLESQKSLTWLTETDGLILKSISTAIAKAKGAA